MKKYKIGIGALIGLLLTAPMSALMYLGNRLVDLPFAPYDLFDWVARILPGPVITFGIDSMVSIMLFLGINVAEAAKTAERTIAVLQFLGAGIVIGMIFIYIMNKMETRANTLAGVLLGCMFGLPIIGISIAINRSPLNPLIKILWLAVLFLGWGLLFGRISAPYLIRPVGEVEEPGEAASVEVVSRRKFIIRVGSLSAAITVIGAGLGSLLAASNRRKAEDTESLAHDVESSTDSPFPNSNDPTMPAPGTRPEYTPIKNHYEVFITTEPPVIPAAGYMLPITGMLNNSLMLTLDDIHNNYEPRSQYVTLSCISGRVGTSLIGTTQWSGVSLQDILADAGIQDNARYLLISSADGFHESVDLDLIASDERIMLCYAWDGHDLPVDHGFPLRIWIPDRYGMKQPKWIISMQVTDQYTEGYWVERSWDELAQIKTTSVIDTVAVNSIIENGDQKLVPVGGIAFAGAREISKVEVRVDSGPWEAAQLRAPLSDATWVIWRYDWPFEAGEHTFEVRCAEGDGTPQIEATQGNRPSGATGIHSFEIDI